MFSQADFKGMGDVKLDEALKEGLDKALELAYDAQRDNAIEKADGDPNKVEKELKKAMVTDPNVPKVVRRLPEEAEQEKEVSVRDEYGSRPIAFRRRERQKAIGTCQANAMNRERRRKPAPHLAALDATVELVDL